MVKALNLKALSLNTDYFPFTYIIMIKLTTLIEFNGNKKTFVKNDVFILPPDTDIVYHIDPRKPWEYYWINFNGTAAKNILSHLGINDTLFFVCEKLPAAKKYFTTAMQAKNALSSRIFTVQSCLFGIFALIADINKQQTTPGANKEKLFFTQILDYITINLCDKKLSAAKVAETFFINASYFSQLFKKNMNTSFKSYINYERIKKATELFETSHMYIKNVGFAVGFSDPLYFSKVFKKYRLYSPEEYRRRLCRPIK